MRAVLPALAVLACAAVARADGEERMAAAPADGPIRVDGRLDEPAWRAARPWSRFVEIFPREGGEPSERTEVRFLHDDATLYVGVTCHDTQPATIARPLARRDDLPAGDLVRVAIDSRHDRRTAYAFAITPAGVLEDRLLHHDDDQTSEWDAVWEGAAAPAADGWTAELAIPLAVLRLRSTGAQTFGVYVERRIGRTHEVIGSALIPSSAGAFVSRFGDLEIGAVDPPRGVELAPFVATRTTLRPQPTDAPGPVPRLTEPSMDLGLDLRAPLGPGLTLTGSINPDFGQVEGDPVILNLTRFEPFFPEKRPFFLQDMDLFEPVRGPGTQQVLYTRRIGLDAPILGAAKVTGEAAGGLEIGVVDAVVTGAGAPRDGPRPDSRVRFHLEQPFRVAPNSALPEEAPDPRNFFAATARRSFGSSSASVHAALATPLGAGCTAADEAREAPPARCQTPGGNALAADVDLRSRGGELGLAGQVAISRVVGGPAERTLPDGTRIARGETGLGAYGVLGKSGGEPLQLDVGWEYASPTLDLNATGFQPDQNVASVSPSLRFVRAGGLGALRSFSAELSGRGAWSTDARKLLRDASAGASFDLVLPSFHEVGCGAKAAGWTWDLREIEGTGIAYERPAFASASCSVTTNRNRSVSLQVSAGATRILSAGLADGAGGWKGNAQAVAFVRPAPRLETRLGIQLAQNVVPGRFIDETDAGLRFGDLLSRSITVKLQQEIVLTPKLSFQLYGELLTALGRYMAYYGAAPPPGDRLVLRDLQPAAAPEDALDFRVLGLRANAVLRWEYRRGSTLFVVWSRQQDGDRALGARDRIDLGLGPLGGAPAVDVFLVKLSFWSLR